MQSSLVIDVLLQVYILSKPLYGCIFHSNQDLQYTGDEFQDKVAQLNMRSSMSDVGCYSGNAAFERFFGSSKHEWLGSTRMMTKEKLQVK